MPPSTKNWKQMISRDWNWLHYTSGSQTVILKNSGDSPKDTCHGELCANNILGGNFHQKDNSMIGVIQTEIIVLRYVMPYNLVSWHEYLGGMLVPTTRHGITYRPNCNPNIHHTKHLISYWYCCLLPFKKKMLLFCWLPIPTVRFMSTAVSNPDLVRSSAAERYLISGSGFATDTQMEYLPFPLTSTVINKT